MQIFKRVILLKCKANLVLVLSIEANLNFILNLNQSAFKYSVQIKKEICFL